MLTTQQTSGPLHLRSCQQQPITFKVDLEAWACISKCCVVISLLLSLANAARGQPLLGHQFFYHAFTARAHAHAFEYTRTSLSFPALHPIGRSRLAHCATKLEAAFKNFHEIKPYRRNVLRRNGKLNSLANQTRRI